MRFQIDHTTRYVYSQPVFLEPHRVLLRPRCDASQCLNQYSLTVHPTPAGKTEGLDAENNDFAILWFNGLHDRLDITVAAEVDTFRTNPYEGLIATGANHLPFQIPTSERASLSPCLLLDGTQAQLEPLQSLGREMLDRVNGDTLNFLNQLNNHLYESMEKVNRLETGIQSPWDTLQTRKGACRDLALVYMTVCRQLGIPARFVSGYQQGDPDMPYRDLHAWAEVYVPGFGWRGFDPTHGLAVADRQIAIAATALPENASPVSGSFRGTGAQATLEHVMTIHTHAK